jgi:hypothetical protein
MTVFYKRYRSNRTLLAANSMVRRTFLQHIRHLEEKEWKGQEHLSRVITVRRGIVTHAKWSVMVIRLFLALEFFTAQAPWVSRQVKNKVCTSRIANPHSYGPETVKNIL